MRYFPTFLDAYAGIGPFFDAFLATSAAHSDKMATIQRIEEDICGVVRPKNLPSDLQTLLSTITVLKEDEETAAITKEINDTIAPFVPTSVVEKLCEVVTEQIPEPLDTALELLWLLSKYGKVVEVLMWINLKNNLQLLSSTTSSQRTQDLATKLHEKIADYKKSDSSFATIHLQQYHLGDSLSGKLEWTFQIRQLSYLEVGLAWKVWDSSLLLSQWIFNYPELFCDKIVLEIGSGCGPVGVVLASEVDAKAIVLTDRIESVLQNIKFNLDLQKEANGIKNKKDKTVEVCRLDWTEENTEFGEQSIDVIVASDIIYDITSATNVPRTIKKLLASDGVAIIVLPSQREGVAEFETNMKATGFNYVVSTVGSYTHSEDGSLNFYMFHFKPDPP